jgi:YD repeat-containing protein
VTDAALNVTTYAYDLENNLTSITDAAGHITSFVYDAFGRVTQTTFPSTLTEIMRNHPFGLTLDGDSFARAPRAGTLQRRIREMQALSS